MAIYNSYIECQNAWRLLGLNGEQSNDIFDISKGWNPQQVFSDLSYHSNIFGTTSKRASWYRNFSPRIYVSLEDIDDMTNNNTYREFVFKNQTAIRFKVTGVMGDRLDITWWFVNLIDNSGWGPSSLSLITTYYDVYEAENSGVYPSEEYENPVKDKFYVTPYFGEMVDTFNDPGWSARTCGIAWTSDLSNAILMTKTPIEGVRGDEGSFDFSPGWGTYTYKYEGVGMFSDSNWSNVPDWFWDGNQADVSVDYPGEDDEDDTGGYGDGEEWDDEVPFADIPTISALGTELVNIYTPDVSELQAFNTWLWSSGYETNVKKLQAAPMENIIAFGFIPYTVTSVAETIKIGGIDTAIASKAASKQYIEVDCESVHVGKYYDSFLDYDAEYQIFLPFIGYKPLRVDDITGADIAVKYLVDILTGTCYAQVKITKYDELVGRTLSNVMYSYMGNCFIELPISGANYARMKQGQMASVVHAATSLSTNVFKGAASGAVAGGVPGALGGGLIGAATSLPDIMTAKQNYDMQRPEYDHGGGLSGNALFTYKKPFIIRTKMVRNVPKNYKQYKGIPSSKFKYLKDIEGFTKVNAVKTGELTNATTEERAEIVSLLQEGVII